MLHLTHSIFSNPLSRISSLPPSFFKTQIRSTILPHFKHMHCIVHRAALEDYPETAACSKYRCVSEGLIEWEEFLPLSKHVHWLQVHFQAQFKRCWC